jgi:hypothetical protein
MGKLDGKVAIVTGAARGLGRAYANGWLAWGLRSQSPTLTSTPTRGSRLKLAR